MRASPSDAEAPVRGERGADSAVVVTPVQEAAWGEKALSQFLETRPLTEDGNLFVRVERIGRKLAQSSDRPNLAYRFMVVRGDDLQAFSFPGGTVCLTESLARLHESDDELAFSLAHELSHVALRHHVSQLRVREILRTGRSEEKALLEALRSRMDRDSEMEADRFGALYAVRAGYKYSASYESLERLARATRGPEEDASHPEFSERIAALKAFKAELERSVDAFKRGVDALGRADDESAITYLSLFVAQFPNSVAGRVNLGAGLLARARRRLGTPEGLAEVLPILPDPGVVVRGSSDIVDLDRAEAQFASALRIDPDDVLARAGLALVTARLGRTDEARRHIAHARDLDRASPDLALCQGNVEYMAGRYPEALARYQETLAIRRDWPPATQNLALTYEKMGEADKARAAWSLLLADEKLGPEARKHLSPGEETKSPHDRGRP